MTCKGCSDCIHCLSAARSHRAGGARPVIIDNYRKYIISSVAYRDSNRLNEYYWLLKEVIRWGIKSTIFPSCYVPYPYLILVIHQVLETFLYSLNT